LLAFASHFLLLPASIFMPPKVFGQAFAFALPKANPYWLAYF
jgi:hypothetical protein